MRKLNKNGVSLPEVLAVLAISAIIAAMVMLFVTQSNRTISTHRENSDIIQEVALTFREFEKALEGKNKVSVNTTTNKITIESEGVSLMTIYNDPSSKIFVEVNGHIFPSSSSTVYDAISFTKSSATDNSENLDLYDFTITVRTTDDDSVELSKTYTTSFLIPIK